MKKYIFLSIFVVSVLAFTTILPVLAENGHKSTEHRLEINNRSDRRVLLLLHDRNFQIEYHLAIEPGKLNSYTIKDGTYFHITYACGTTANGKLEIIRQLRLVFTPCSGLVPNQGAPAREKIHLPDSPHGIAWFYNYESTSRPGSPTQPGAGVPVACQLIAKEEVTIYDRPSQNADIFSIQAAGFSQTFSARTSNGWLGFDPGVAQAANIGSFRLRWVKPNSSVLTGACNKLPVVWGPPPGICFDMPMDTVNVYASPDPNSQVVATLQLGEFAGINGTSSNGDWANIDLSVGNTGLSALGWVESNTLNVNGPCGELPTITP
jgi:hypothetical protein